MRRFIMFIFLVLSLLAIVAYTVTLDTVFGALGISFNWDEFIASFKNVNTFREWMAVFSMVLGPLFSVYGVPIIVFLISFNGLFQVRKCQLN